VTTAARYSSRRTLRNGALSAAQVVVVGATLLLAYRLALTEVTREEFGLYATLFAVGTLTQVGTLGFAGGAARHMARAVGEGDLAARLQVVAVSVAVSLAGSLVVAAVLLGGLEVYGSGLDPALAEVASRLVPAVVAAALVTPVSTAVQGLADGLGQAHVRSLVVIVASVVFYVVVAVTLSGHGVVSLAWAALAQQSLVVLALLGLVLRDCRPSRATWHWSSVRWREMRAFNLKFQLMTLPALALEPLAKLLLGAFAGFSAVATYEVVNRLMQQVNAVILAANQAVVPLVAFRSASGDLQDAAVFRQLFQAAWALCVTAFAAALIILAPLGLFVFGEADPALLGFGVVLCLGWLANALAGPAYFVSVTTNRFTANVVANYLMVATPAVLGTLLGWLLGGIGVAAAVALGLVVAGFVMNRSFLVSRDLPWSGILTRRDAAFGLFAAVLVAVTLVAGPRLGTAGLGVAAAALAVLGAAGLVHLRHGPVWPVLTRREG
jgi:O-antigen/teichoic acid export membrane protein